MAKRRFGRGGSSKSNPFQKNIGKGRRPVAKNNLKTTGGEYTLDRYNHAAGSAFTFDTTTTQDSSTPDGFSKSLKITPDSNVNVEVRSSTWNS